MTRVWKTMAVVAVLHAALFMAADSVAGTEEGRRYTVQIAALSKPQPEIFEQAAVYGPVHRDAAAGGLERVSVGSVASLQEATELRDKLRAAGFADAFVKLHHNAQTSTRVTARLQAWADEQQGELVMLDGVPHLKQGDVFLPATDIE